MGSDVNKGKGPLLETGLIIRHIDGVWEVVDVEFENPPKCKPRFTYTVQHVENCNGEEIQYGRQVWGAYMKIAQFFSYGNGKDRRKKP